MEKRLEQGLFFIQENREYAFLDIEDPMKNDIPKTFEEAWYHPDPEERRRWRRAIKNEYGGMKTRKLMKKVKKEDIPLGRKLIGYKWIFTKKRDGTYKARLVAKGFTQVAGVDFTAHKAPVMQDASFRLMLLYLMLYGVDAITSDVAMAFINGYFSNGEVLFMEAPKGMEDIDPKRNVFNY